MKMEFEVGDVVELIDEYRWSGKPWPDYERRIRAGGNKGVVTAVEATHRGVGYYSIEWEGLAGRDNSGEYTSIGAIDADCVRLYNSKPVTDAEVEEILKSLATSPWDPASPAYGRLPSPVVSESGHRKCNEPFIVNGYTVGYCDEWVPGHGKKAGTHKGDHKITWKKEA